MDIKFNPDGNRISKPGMGKGGNIQRDPAFNIKDTFIKGEKPLDILGKHIFKSVTSSPAQKFDSVTASESLQSSSVSAAVPATMGIPLSNLISLLSENRVSFYEERRFRIPHFMDKRKLIDADEAQKILTNGTDSQKKGLQARVDSNTILGFQVEDARDLVALKNLDKSGKIKPDDMMKLLEKASEFGAEIKVKGTETSGVYPAYRHLAGRGVEEKIADAPVIIERAGIELLTIEPGQKGNVKAYEVKLNNWMDIFKRAGDKPSVVKEIIEPVGKTTLDERFDMAGAILKYTGGSNKSDIWKNAKIAYKHLREKSSDGSNFRKMGDQFLEALKAYGSDKWDSEYLDIIDIIADKLQDKPADFDVFTNLLKNKVYISTAIKMYDNLPLPVKEGDFSKVASTFIEGKFHSTNAVKIAMKPVGDSSLADRIDVLKGIYKHSKGYYSGDQWENTEEDYDYIKTLSHDGKDFVKTGKLYCRMLNAYNSECRDSNYRMGLDLISKELKDKPEDFDVFIKLLKNNVIIYAAEKMYKQLATPVKPGDYEKVASVFLDKSFYSTDVVEIAMKPVGDSSLSDRLDVLKGIYKHSGGYYSSDQWEKTKEDYEYIKTLSHDGKDFVKTGKLYCRMLDTNGSESHDSSYRTGLDLITGKLRDRPDDFENFIKLLKNDVSINSAITMYDGLLQPVKDGDYERVSTIFLSKKFYTRNQVKLAMTNIEGTTLEERVDILSGTYRHAEDSYESHKWDHTVEAFDNLKSKTVNGKDLVRIGNMFVEMLDANGSGRWSDDYNKGMDFIKDKLKDNPDEYRQFISLLKNGVSISSAVKMYEMLTQPVKKGDYERVSNAFLKSDFHQKKFVEVAMKPVDGTPLQDKIDILKGIYEHTSEPYEYQQWDHTQKDYESIIDRSTDGKTFRDTSRMYIEMLDANNLDTHKFYCRDGLDLIISDLREKPEDFKTFIDIIKAGESINSAVKMYTMLPKPVEKGEYQRVTSLFINNQFSSPENVSLVMTKLWKVPIEDRIEIAKGIYDHSEGGYSGTPMEKTSEDYEYIRKRARNGDDFVKIGKMYVKLLDARGSKGRCYGYKFGLQEISTRFKKNPKGFESFLRIVGGSEDIKGSIEAYDTIQKSVKNLDYETREKIATKLVGEHFKKIYDIVILQLKPDENFEEIAELYRAIASNHHGEDYKEVSDLVTKILENRGELDISVLAQLADNFKFSDSDHLMHTIEILKRPVKDTSDKEKVDIFNEIFEDNFKSNKNKTEYAVKDFEAFIDGIAPEETLKDAYKRFKLLTGIVRRKKEISYEEIKSAFVMLAEEFRKGAFGSKTIEDVTVKLGENLILAESARDAMDQLIHSMSVKKEKTIEVGDGEINIGGVKLKIKGDRK